MGIIEDVAYVGEGKKLKEKKKKKKKSDRKHEVAKVPDLMGATEADISVKKKRKKKMHGIRDGIASEFIYNESMNALGFTEADDDVKKKRKMKKKSRRADDDSASLDAQPKITEVISSAEVANNVITKKKKKKDKKEKIQEVSNSIASEDAQVKPAKMMGLDDADVHSVAKKKKKRKLEVSTSEKADSVSERKQRRGTLGSFASEDNQIVEASEVFADSEKKNKPKKTKELPKNNSESDHSIEKLDDPEGSKKLKKRKRDADASDSTKKSEAKKKRVSFSDTVEVLNLPEHLKYRKLNSEGDLVQGKRYTPEEDAKIMQAVDEYILEHRMANDGVDRDLDDDWKNARKMIMNCKEHPKLKGCWKDISLAIPRRTQESIYQRAHLIYERAEDRNWTKEEIDMVLRFHAINGPKWREIADALGKSRKHVKDAYRRNKLTGEKKGSWSQEEYQKLFDLVNHDICLKALEEKKIKHGMLRDNIAWGAISEAIGTRASPTCCTKWYNQLCSSMVVEGIWSDTDDYKLVDALYNQDACCIEDVEWDSLLEHRSGDLCRRRWAEMARNLGEHRLKPFLEQVEVLHQRYDRDMVEAREIYEKKKPVDV